MVSGHDDDAAVQLAAPEPAEEPTGAVTPRVPAKKPSSIRSLVEWVAVIAGALGVALVIRIVFLAAFYIPSESMVPTLEKGDRVLVNKLSYKLHDIHRGDVVVFSRPPGEADTGIKDLIKRVIGLPGETLEVRDCRVLINGQPLEEPYVKSWSRTCTSEPRTIGPKQIFVMGDNRDDSQDSRFFGPIDESLVVGRAFIIVWPLTHLGWL
jgi:signal peptidase I